MEDDAPVIYGLEFQVRDCSSVTQISYMSCFTVNWCLCFTVVMHDKYQTVIKN